MASKAKSEAKPADPRGKIVAALMELASERRIWPLQQDCR